MKVAVLLFKDFEKFESSGPVEILSGLKDHYQVGFYSLHGGAVKSSSGISVETDSIENTPENTDILIIPGGPGAREAADNQPLVEKIGSLGQSSKYILTTNEGSGLLAKAGLLKSKTAACNREGYVWIQEIDAGIRWMIRAKWVVDDNYYTSVGPDGAKEMTAAFLIDRHGTKAVSKWIEQKDGRSKTEDRRKQS